MGHLNYARIEDLYPATSILQYTKLFSVWNTYEVKIGGVVWAIPLKGSVMISSKVNIILKCEIYVETDVPNYVWWNRLQNLTCLSCLS